ncbi:hypothetical protein SSE37_01650 [Sagittula stellata E-37]|uniref:Uncharacterized protein n=2 Tax=Sagittula stellata TaxID=52603 RepID=A3K4L8_SAGS3|nr:hypothetical protein SSE37_01650 [Sagittula stellata E-37]
MQQYKNIGVCVGNEDITVGPSDVADPETTALKEKLGDLASCAPYLRPQARAQLLDDTLVWSDLTQNNLAFRSCAPIEGVEEPVTPRTIEAAFNDMEAEITEISNRVLEARKLSLEFADCNKVDELQQRYQDALSVLDEDIDQAFVDKLIGVEACLADRRALALCMQRTADSGALYDNFRQRVRNLNGLINKFSELQPNEFADEAIIQDTRSDLEAWYVSFQFACL